MIANLEELSLHSNPLLDIDALPYENFKNLTNLYLSKTNAMNVSKIAKLPSKLVALSVDLNENPSAAYFQHLTKLKTLYIYAKIDLEYHSFSRLPSLEELYVEYVTPASQVLKITLEGCPVSLSYIDLTIEEGDVESLQNKCRNISSGIHLTTNKPCNCGVFNELNKTGVGEYCNSLNFYLFTENLVE